MAQCCLFLMWNHIGFWAMHESYLRQEKSMVKAQICWMLSWDALTILTR
jgi:hypothetical protein